METTTKTKGIAKLARRRTRAVLIATAVACAALAFAPNAEAQDEWWSNNSGEVGVGVGSHLVDGGVGALGGGFLGGTGLSLRYFASRTLGFEAVIGGDRVSSTADQGGTETTTTSSQFDISLLAEYQIARSNRAVLSGFGGFGFSLGKTTVEPEGGDETTTDLNDFAVELGVRGEVFLTEHFSMFGRTGINIDPVGDAEGAESGLDLSIFRGQPLGMFGFTVWFG